jgi:cation diffusion facilitator CzcD-associated flavoprotein CzcO
MSADIPPEQVTFAIIGSGFSGLGAAIRLQQAGQHDLVILERAQDVGGTWRDNTYPGCRCDVQSNLYSYSFALKPDWTESFPSQPELWQYLRKVTADHGLARYLRFGHEVTSARWDEQASRWRIATTQGDFEARYLIAGIG